MMKLTPSSSMSLVVAAALWIATGLIVGQTWGDDLQVNTYTTSFQIFPDVAWGADGQFVVVWQSDGSSADPTNVSVQAQRYSADDTPIGAQFQVNTYFTDSSAPWVAMAQSGEFVVTWTTFLGSASYDYGAIQAQRFAADGSFVGDEFQVNTNTQGNQLEPAMSMRPTGEFVVVWRTYTYFIGSYDLDINGRLFASDGTPVGEEFQISANEDSVYDHSVAMGPDGHFMVVWDQEESGYGAIMARLYASDGSSVGGAFQVNEDNFSYGDRQPSIASNMDGEFIVAWAGLPYMISGDEIHARRLAADGALLGDQFQVSTYTSSNQADYPSVASGAAGNFIVAWQSSESSGTDTSDTSVHARFFSSDNSPLSGEFQVNTYTTDDQLRSSVAMGPAGGYAIAWHSEGSQGTDTSSWSIQRSPGAMIFADGFESGDTSAWSEP